VSEFHPQLLLIEWEKEEIVNLSEDISDDSFLGSVEYIAHHIGILSVTITLSTHVPIECLSVVKLFETLRLAIFGNFVHKCGK